LDAGQSGCILINLPRFEASQTSGAARMRFARLRGWRNW
jgi:hypothetical protein